MRILSLLLSHSVINQNTLRLRQNSRHFADDILKCMFLHKDVWVSIKISLKFVPRGPINNIPALVQIMAWRRPGNKPLSEPMMASLLKYVCVTPPQWVKNQSPYLPQGTTPALLSHIWTTLAATCPSSRKTRDWWRQTRETRRPYHRKVRFVHPSTRCCRTNPINVPSLKQRIRNLKKNDGKNSIRNFSKHTLSDLDIPTHILHTSKNSSNEFHANLTNLFGKLTKTLIFFTYFGPFQGQKGSENMLPTPGAMI